MDGDRCATRRPCCGPGYRRDAAQPPPDPARDRRRRRAPALSLPDALARGPSMSPRAWRIVAITYAVKTLLVGLAWLAVPELPERAETRPRQACKWADDRKRR